MSDLALTSDVLNIVAEQGKDWEFLVTIEGNVNLAGYRVRWQLRTSADDADIVLERDSASGEITIIGDSFTFLVPAAVTASVTARRYVHGFELIEPDGGKPPFIAGTFTVQPGVVR
jgi:hypothetical protein